MLETLSCLFGVSGYEDEVRDFILKKIKPFCTGVSVDNIGNLIAYKKGTESTRKVLLTAHMDEVGFIVKFITDDGYVKFEAVGGIDSRVLPGKRVIIGKNRIPGIIGIKAVHMCSEEERRKPVSEDKMYIDIGADCLKEAEKLVAKGDFIMFDSAFIRLSKNTVAGKALDNRSGCYALIELLKKDYENDLYAVFTVQEEIGLRGAEICTNQIMPDMALILETTICAETSGTEPQLEITKLREGPAISIMERTAFSNRGFTNEIKEIAIKNDIPCQFKRTGLGGNEAGAVQHSGSGVKTAVLSVPCRYIHSPYGIINLKDVENLIKLSEKIIE